MSTTATPMPRPVRSAPLIESEVFGMMIFVFCEVMLFAGFISSYALVGARAPVGWWPPPGDPALPVLGTGVASLALLGSGVAVWRAGGQLSVPAAAVRSMTLAVLSASVFCAYQAVEFVRLVRVGFTLQSSAHGGFFYTIIGAHGLHALVAVGVLAWAARRLTAGALSSQLFTAIRLYWYFVVALWPALYAVVYL